MFVDALCKVVEFGWLKSCFFSLKLKQCYGNPSILESRFRFFMKHVLKFMRNTQIWLPVILKKKKRKKEKKKKKKRKREKRGENILKNIENLIMLDVMACKVWNRFRCFLWSQSPSFTYCNSYTGRCFAPTPIQNEFIFKYMPWFYHPFVLSSPGVKRPRLYAAFKTCRENLSFCPYKMMLNIYG